MTYVYDALITVAVDVAIVVAIGLAFWLNRRRLEAAMMRQATGMLIGKPKAVR